MRKYLFLLAPILLAMFPVLFSGRIFASGDVLNLILPNFEFYGQALKSGESFLWNPYEVAGFPIFASFTGLFSPLYLLLFRIFSVPTAYHLGLLVNLSLAAIITAKFLKDLGLSHWAQILGSLTFVFSQWFIVSDLGIVNTFPILPLLLWILWRSREGKSKAFFVGGIFALSYLWLAGHYNWQLMILLAATAFALFLGRRVLFKWALMNLGGIALGLVQLWPAFVYSQFSSRGTGISFREAVVGAIGIFDLPKIFLPFFRWPVGENAESLLYLGVIPLFLFFLGFFVRASVARFFAGLFAVSFAISIKYSPLFWLLNKLPFFESFRGPSRWMFPGFFAAAVLAAYGLDHYEAVGLRLKKIFAYGLGLSGLFVIAGSIAASLTLLLGKSQVLAWLLRYFERAIYPRTSKLPLEHYQRVIENIFNNLQETFDFGNPRFLLSMLVLFAGSLVVFLASTDLQRVSRKFLTVLSVLSFTAIFVLYQPTLPRSAWRGSSAVADFLRSNPPPGRILTFLPGFTQWYKLTVPYGDEPQSSLALQHELLSPHLFVRFLIPSADGYENLMPEKLAVKLSQLGSERATAGEKLADQKLPPEEKAKIFTERKSLLDELGVRFIVSAFPLDEQVFRKIFETSATAYQIPVFVYENPEAESVIDAGEQAKLEILSQKNNYLKVRGEFPAEQNLIWRQNNLPGWRVYLDGRMSEILPAEDFFIGVKVPSGVHEIVFEYHYWDLFNFSEIFAKIRAL